MDQEQPIPETTAWVLTLTAEAEVIKAEPEEEQQ